MVNSEIVTNFVNALLNKFENKVANKKNDISGDFSSDNASYPTVRSVKNFFGNKVNSWSNTVSNDNYPSEKLVKDSLDGKLDIAQGSGSTKINKNVVTNGSGNITLEDKPTIPSKTSDLINDGDGTNVFVKNNDSRLSDARTPTSHTHGNITNDGKIGSTSGKIVTTSTNGTLVATEDMASLGGQVTIAKQQTAEEGYFATYVISQGGTALSPKINIPKDFLVKSASLKTCTQADVPEEGYIVGDKYLDFVINVKEGSATDQHIYINLKLLTDVYSADESTLTLDANGQFKIKNGGVTTTQLSSGVNTSLGYADAWNISPASGITVNDITAWNGKSNITTNDVDSEIESYLTAITTALTT